jgi:hypothetical protein
MDNKEGAFGLITVASRQLLWRGSTTAWAVFGWTTRINLDLWSLCTVGSSSLSARLQLPTLGFLLDVFTCCFRCV